MAEEDYGKDFVERRRPTVMVLEPEQAQMFKNLNDNVMELKTNVMELKTIVTHPELGILPLLKRHDKTLYGNGWPGLKVQTAAIWIIVGLLGTDNPLVRKLIDLWWK